MKNTHEVAILWSIVFSFLTICPVLLYLFIGWPWKRNEIFVMLDSKSKQRYMMTFQRQECSVEDASAAFQSFYDKWYGRKIFLAPTILLGILSMYYGSLLAETGMYYLNTDGKDAAFKSEYTALPLTAAAAVAGAFLFVSWDLATRAVRRDMFWNDVLLGALRIALSIAIGYAISSIAQDHVGPFIAFVSAALPVEIIAMIGRRYLNKTFNLDIGAAATGTSNTDQLISLSGIDAVIADRIADADITSISQLAYCDPIQLAMRTNLNFAFLLDGISQAQAWLYIGSNIKNVCSMGFRGAYELKTFYDEKRLAAPTDRDRFEILANDVAERLKISSVAFENLLSQVAEDPYTKFMVEVFSTTGDSVH